MRKIRIGGTIWEYRIGRSKVKFRNDNESFAVGVDIVANKSVETIDRGRSKKTSDGMITPSMIRDYLTWHTQLKG